MKTCKPWSSEESETLRRLWPTGKPREIAEVIGRSVRGVLHRADRLQLVKSPDYSGTRQFDPNFQFFRVWTPELAYALGLLSADGNVCDKNHKHILQMSLQQRDGYMLHRLAMLCGGRTFPIEKKRAVGWNLSGKSLVADLKSLGLEPRKTKRMTVPFVPRHLQSHFVRGYFDGDGSAGIYRVTRGSVVTLSMCGNVAFLSGLREVIHSHVQMVGKTVPRPHKGDLYNMRFSTREDLLRLIPWMYADATLFLTRKKETADKIIALAKGAMFQMARRRA